MSDSLNKVFKHLNVQGQTPIGKPIVDPRLGTMVGQPPIGRPIIERGAMPGRNVPGQTPMGTPIYATDQTSGMTQGQIGPQNLYSYLSQGVSGQQGVNRTTKNAIRR